jgi:hypothetical protein
LFAEGDFYKQAQAAAGRRGGRLRDLGRSMVYRIITTEIQFLNP